MTRKNLIKLFGHLSPETGGILKTKCYRDIVKHLGKYDKEAFPVLLEHFDEVSIDMWYYWGEYVGNKDIIIAKLLEIGNPECLCYWGWHVDNKDIVLAKLQEVGDPEWLYY